MRILLVSLLLLALPMASAEGVFMTDTRTATTAAGPSAYALSDAMPADSKTYTATSYGALGYATEFSYSVLEPFTPAGTVTGKAFVSCDVQTVFRPGVSTGPNPVATARMEFVKDGTVVATSNLYSLRTCDGPADVWEAAFETDAFAGTTFATGAKLGLNLILWVPNGPPGTAAENVYVLVGPSFASGLFGEGIYTSSLAEEPTSIVVHENITDGFSHSWATPRDATHLMNFTAQGPTKMSLNITASQGTGFLHILDGDGATIFESTMENGTSEMELTGAPGVWSINATYAAFVGDVSASFAAVAAEEQAATGNQTAPPKAGESGGEGETPAEPGNAGNETVDDVEDAPALPAAILLVSMLWLARRRS